MNEQLTIFDWLPEIQEELNINTVSEAEAVAAVGRALGLRFVYDPKRGDYRTKVGKLKLGIGYYYYTLPDNQNKFLGVDYSYGTSGGCAPLDGIPQAVKYFRDKINRYGG